MAGRRAFTTSKTHFLRFRSAMPPDLVKVGKLLKDSLEYKPGQLFLHKAFAYRGVILWPFNCRVVNKANPKEAMDKEETIPFYHVLIHRDDFQYVNFDPNMTAYLTVDEKGQRERSLSWIRGMECVMHEDVMPYNSEEPRPIDHDLFDRLFEKVKDSTTGVEFKLKQDLSGQRGLSPHVAYRLSQNGVQLTMLIFYLGSTIIRGEMKHVWRYTIRLFNCTKKTIILRQRDVKLYHLSKLEFVSGRGTEGQCPALTPQVPVYQFTSVLYTGQPKGTHFWGSMKMEAEDGTTFDVGLPSVALEVPNNSNSTTGENEEANMIDKNVQHEPIEEAKETLKAVNGLTLGQTLKEELKKSSKILLQNSQKKSHQQMNAKIVSYPLPSLNSDDTLEKSKEESVKKSPNENKRKRPRRNPVWQYFDVDDGIAKCLCQTNAGKKCEYSTKSVFSTNLKVHLKSHHKAEFAIVLQAEEAMAQAVASQQAKQQSTEKLFDFRRADRFNTHLSAVDQQNGNTLISLLNNNNLNKSDACFDGSANLTLSTLIDPQKSLLKRKRLRRHPVWHFFKDIDDKTVGCVMCDFKTISAFSTNLKMHLKSHHKEQHQHVLKMEGDQRFDDDSLTETNGDLSSSNKKARNDLNGKDHNRSESPRSEQPITLFDPNLLMLSASEQLAAVVGMLCSTNSTDTSNGLENLFNGVETDNHAQLDKMKILNGLLDSSRIEATSSASSDLVEDSKQERISDLILQIHAIPETNGNRPLLAGLKKQVRDIALARLMHSIGDVQLFLSPAFQEFVTSLCPEYALPRVEI
uniref:ApaG domain-containing protein n=1 Tax=Acrobeloides nanus TaxID=290746 RepID=A0A914CE35_9BILA